MRSKLFLIFTPLLLLVFLPSLFAGDAGLEFFEKKIRPALASHCFECHSSRAKKQRGGLLLDSRDGIRKGGDSGPVLKPGDPDRSLLIKAVRYDGLEMPPKKKGQLPARTLADLEAWVRMGAPIPPDRRSVAAADSWPDVLKERRQWWSLQPVHKPSVPSVKDAAWSANPVDRFLLAALEKAGLRPAPDAGRATLIRRLSLVLTGLPPTPDEVKAFLKDQSPEALPHLVDRLLASPHFGERWARHSMDVVRFSETHGKEWNFDTPHAWRYRDYLIRAFNDDVPYDQLIREHLAGDLLCTPRRHCGEGFNESVIGTAFFHFGEMDIEGGSEFPQLDFDVFDNQIDTLSKAFQGTTVACARCHDHKLDAVSMKDYYALLGVLRSSRMVTHTIDPPERHARALSQLRRLKAKIREELGNVWLSEAQQVGRYLQAAQARLDHRADAVELAQGLDAKRLDNWQRALKPDTIPVKDKPKKKKHNEAVQDPLSSLLAPWRASCSVGQADFAGQWKKLAEKLAADDRAAKESNDKNFVTYADFRQGDFGGWKVAGQGFREGPARAGEFTLRPDGDDLVKMILPSGCYTHLLSEKLNGTLRSPLLPPKIKRISFEVLGEHSSIVRLVENNGQLNIAFHRALTKDQWHWITFTRKEGYESLRLHAELLTMFDNPRFPDQLGKAEAGDAEDNRVPWEKAAENPRSFFGIRRVVLHEGEAVPRPEADFLRPLFAGPLPHTPAEVAQRYAAVVENAVAAWASDEAGDNDALWLDAFVRHGLFSNHAGRTRELQQLAAQYRAIEKELAVPRIVPGLEDFGAGFDQPVFQRGDCMRPDAPVARRYLEVLSKSGERFQAPGSGRLELAQRIASAENPLTARVMVNRIWHHLFGTGLVRTVDDFGHLGEKPSHPELLDYLAARFVEDGWSVKRLLRALVLTRAFRMASPPSASARAVDPLNRLLQHYPARRLEAEAIRDAILAASGRLERTLYGLSIEPFRDKEEPAQRRFLGPLDGRGRRSIYIKNTMMEGPKFLVAFNFPSGKVAQGRRDVTNVPAQALALLNDPFVVQQAGVWAERLTARPDTSVAARIELMFWVGLGRPPTPEEQEAYQAAAASLARVHRVPLEKILASRDVWQDLAHVLFNVKEFIYIP